MLTNPTANGHASPVASILDACERAEVDAGLLHTPPGNAEPTLEDVQGSGLLPNIEQHGQFLELMVYPHHRALCLRHLGRMARVILLPKAPSHEELITLRVSLASTCKKVDKGLIGCDMFTWLSLAPGRTERDAAVHFGLSPGYVNKLCSPFKNGIEELVEALKARKLAPTAASFVASLTREQQREILPNVLGKKRSAVMGICDFYKPPKARGAGKPFKVTVCGVTLTMREPAPERRLDRLRGVRERIGDVLKQVEKDPRLAPALAQLLAG
jgi:hypothetical protein